MLTLIIILLALRVMRGGWFYHRPWGLWGMPCMWHRPPMRGPHMGGFGPGHGMGRHGRF